MSQTGKTTAPPTVDAASSFLANVEGFAARITSALAPTQTVTTPGGETLSAIQAFLALAGEGVATFAPEATIAGFAVSKAIALAGEIASAAPDALAAVDRVKAAINGGAAPTPAEWAALDAAADAAHAKLQAAAAAFLAKQGDGSG